jgi:hypothetical protein
LWIGPYPVCKKVSIDTYTLQLPIGLRLHPDFHTSLLKPYAFDQNPNRVNKPNEGMIAAGGHSDGYLVEKIVDHKRNQKNIMYKVKWLGYPNEENTWEPFNNLKRPASDLIIEYLNRKRLNIVEWMPQTKRRRLK